MNIFFQTNGLHIKSTALLFLVSSNCKTKFPEKINFYINLYLPNIVCLYSKRLSCETLFRGICIDMSHTFLPYWYLVSWHTQVTTFLMRPWPSKTSIYWVCKVHNRYSVTFVSEVINTTLVKIICKVCFQFVKKIMRLSLNLLAPLRGSWDCT